MHGLADLSPAQQLRAPRLPRRLVQLTVGLVGPRDGLMTGLVQLTGGSVRLVRTSIEVTVVAAGFLLGGTFGVGTALYALAVGSCIQLFLPRCIVVLDDSTPAVTAS